MTLFNWQEVWLNKQQTGALRKHPPKLSVENGNKLSEPISVVLKKGITYVFHSKATWQTQKIAQDSIQTRKKWKLNNNNKKNPRIMRDVQ